MRSLGLYAAAVSAAVLASCSNAGVQGNGAALPGAAALPAPGYAERVHLDAISTHDLFVPVVVGFSPAYVLIYQNGTFKKIGQIKLPKGSYNPFGSWVDTHGLYVTTGSNIVEYSSIKSKPFVYSAGIYYPIAVTSDALGDVFEGDSGGWVNEYAQKSNYVKKTCNVGLVTGVAVDPYDNVFAAFVTFTSPYVGYIVEFTDFSTCYGQMLAVTTGAPGNMALDKSNNILLADYGAKTIDIIKSPYSKVSSHLGSGFQGPEDVTINSANNRVWVTDYLSNIVYDLYYPSGKKVGSITFMPSSYIGAFSAVDGSNYVP